MQNEENNIWYLELPVYRYNEDVQELAKAAGLRIIDAAVTDDRTGAAPDEELPTVSLREEFTPEYLAEQASRVPVEKMESTLIAKIRDQFRAMPYEQQLAAYHASIGEQPKAEEETAAPAATSKVAPRGKKGAAPAAAEPEQKESE